MLLVCVNTDEIDPSAMTADDCDSRCLELTCHNGVLIAIVRAHAACVVPPISGIHKPAREASREHHDQACERHRHRRHHHNNNSSIIIDTLKASDSDDGGGRPCAQHLRKSCLVRRRHLRAGQLVSCFLSSAPSKTVVHSSSSSSNRTQRGMPSQLALACLLATAACMHACKVATRAPAGSDA